MFNTRSFTFVRPGLNGLTRLFLTVKGTRERVRVDEYPSRMMLIRSN